MKFVFVQTINLNRNHIRILKVLHKTRIGWDDNLTGRVLDDLECWGLVKCDYGYGAELYHLTEKGKSALNQACLEELDNKNKNGK